MCEAWLMGWTGVFYCFAFFSVLLCSFCCLLCLFINRLIEVTIQYHLEWCGCVCVFFMVCVCVCVCLYVFAGCGMGPATMSSQRSPFQSSQVNGECNHRRRVEGQ